MANLKFDKLLTLFIRGKDYFPHVFKSTRGLGICIWMDKASLTLTNIYIYNELILFGLASW